jgi:DNA-binding IclR family transcriptional regulator
MALDWRSFVELLLRDGPAYPATWRLVLRIDRVQDFRRRATVAGPELAAGSRVPAYCTALGKILLAYLPEQERRGLPRDSHHAAKKQRKH